MAVGEYQAGSAYLTLNPKLANDFRATVKTLLEPVKAKLNVKLTPKLAKGFEADLKELVNTAAEAASAKIEFGHKLAPKFRSTLKAAAKLEAEKAGKKIHFRPELAAGFTTDLRGKVAEAAAGIEATVTVKLSTAGLRQKIRGLKTEMPAAQLGVKLDFTQAVADLEAFRATVAATPLSLNVNADTSAAVAQLMALRTLASDVGDRVNSIGSGAGIGRSARRLTGGILLRPIRAIRLQVELDRASVSRAEAELANVVARLQLARRQQGDSLDQLNLAQQRHDEVMANGNATMSQRTAATTRLARAQRDQADATGRLTSLMGQERDAHEQVGRARSRQGSLMSSLSAGWAGFQSAATKAITSAAKNLFSFSNLLGIAKVALIGLAVVSLIPLIGQLAQAAGVIALFPAALTGFAAVIATIVVGANGIGDAFKAAQKVTDGASKQAESHAKAVASAQKQAASAARSVASAERGVVSAERGVQSAQKASATAQKALNKAREDATEELEDLNRALGRASLTEEGAAIAVAEAYEAMLDTFKDSDASATDRRRAVHSYNEALADQQDTMRESRELQDQVNEANAKGVEGSDQVVAATERVAEAAQGEIDAQQSLSDAKQSLADANSQLVEAQQEVIKAMNDGGDAAEEFERKMAKLSPAAQDFVKKWLAIKPELSKLGDGVQENLFDRMGDSVSSLVTKWIPTLQTGLGKIATQINSGLRRAFADLETDATRSKLDHIFGKVADSIGPVIDGLTDMIQGFLSLSQVGSNFMPSGAQGFADLMARFREWAESPEGQTKFHDFIERSLTAFGRLKDLVVELGKLIGGIFSGSSETGETMLDDITNKLKGWAESANSPEGQKAIKEFFQDVKTTADAVVHAIEKIIELMGDVKASAPAKVLGGIFNDKKVATGPDGKPIVDENGKEVEVDKTTQERVGEYLGGLGEGVKYNIPVRLSLQLIQSSFDYVKSGWGKVKAEWDDIADDFGPALDDFKSDLGGFRDSVVGWFGDIGTAAMDNLRTNATGALFTLSNAVPGLRDKLNELSKDGSLSFGDMGRAILSSIADITGVSGFAKLVTDSDSLSSFFGNLVTEIGNAWAELPSKLAGPINSVIDNLNSLGEIWNKVAGKLGLPTWEPMTHVGTSSTTDPFAGRPTRPEAGGHVGGRWMGGPGANTFAGQVTGPGGPKEDKAGLFKLSAGEHVWTADEVAAAGGHKAMYDMRAAALNGGGTQSKHEGDGPGGYANGGVVSTSDPLDPIQAQLWDLVRTAIPDAVLTSGKRYADVGSGYDLHMQGKAIDLGGPMQDIARWIYNTYPQSAELIHWPLNGWQNLDEGQPHDFGASTNAQHQDHVHWAANDFLGNLSDEEKASIFSRIGSALSGAVSSGRNALANTLLLNPLRAAANNVPELSGFGDAGKIPKAFAQKLVESLASRVLGSGSSGSGGANYNPTAGVEQWREMAVSAMRREGFNADDPAQVNAMMAQIQSESGGNPSIIQGVQDINSGGNEAQGLLQVIPGTFAAFRDPSLPDDRTDPMANMVAALRYYKSKYGNDLTTMWGQGHGYDQGGIFPNGTFGWNASGLPEAVLTNPQWVMFRQFIDNMGGQNPETASQAQTIPETLNTDTLMGTTPSTTTDSSVDTWDTLRAKGESGLAGIASAFLEGQFDSIQNVTGMPDPRDTGLYEGITGYASDYSTWANAKSASAAATQALSSSNWGASSSPSTSTANQATSTSGGTGAANGGQILNDYSTTINITPSDTQEAFRQANQIADVRALQHTARK